VRKSYSLLAVAFFLICFLASDASPRSLEFIPDADPVPALEQQHRATHHINLENILEGDSCSATAVGPHTLLTAGHCLMATSKIKVDGEVANITNLVFDDADHMLVVTDATFVYWLRIDQTALPAIQPGTPVHMWGNPGHSVDLFRAGVFKKWDSLDEDTKLAVFQLPIYAGDSGSGLINDSGALIAVASLGDQSADAAVFVLQFTSEQLSQIK